jgi:2-polyprenyl-3-methyl-5-hydroxy-6-metoxy-1,4-benzoquinol methylase
MIPTSAEDLRVGIQASQDVDTPFAETSYGIVKRVQVIGEWIGQVRRQTGRSRLTILDFGCGTGDHLTFPLARLGHEVLGLDFHEASVQEARRRYALPNLSFRTDALEDLTGKGLTFDVIVCSEVLEHLREPQDLLAALRPLLRSGGGLIVTTPNGFGAFETLCRLERVLKRIGVHQLLRWVVWRTRQLTRRLRGRPVPVSPLDLLPGNETPGFLNADSPHVQFFRLGRLERLFRENGYRVVARRARTFLCGPYVDVAFLLWPWRQRLLRLNNRLADLLPFAWAADWMFLLEREEGLGS